jgi:hypothetical protein
MSEGTRRAIPDSFQQTDDLADHNRYGPGGDKRDKAEDGTLEPETAAGVGAQSLLRQTAEVWASPGQTAPAERSAKTAGLKVASDQWDRGVSVVRAIVAR